MASHDVVCNVCQALGGGVGPSGAGAHLLLFRPPAPTEPEHGRSARAADVNKELRKRAEAYRRAFGTSAGALTSPPNGWWWHGSLATRSWARFVRRWVAAESALREGGGVGGVGGEAPEAAAEEARASVAATLLTALLEATTPDVAQNAALALAAPALLRGGGGGGRRGGSDGGGAGSSNEGHAEATTDVLLEKLGGSTVGRCWLNR